MVSPTYKSLQSQISQLQKKAQKILAAESKNKNAGLGKLCIRSSKSDVMR